MFLNQLRDRLRDCFKQNLHAKISESTFLKCYSGYKSYFQPENYLNNVMFDRRHKQALTRFRMGVSEINAHRFRFNPNRDLLMCQFCKNKEIEESELHVILICPLYKHIRQIYIENRYILKADTQALNNLISSNSPTLARYLALMFSLRRDYLNNLAQ